MPPPFQPRRSHSVETRPGRLCPLPRPSQVRDPQLIVDLFLNYDCDLEGKGIFTSMCDDLSRLAATNQALTESTEQAGVPTCPHRLMHSNAL